MKKMVVCVLSVLVLITALAHDVNAQRRNDSRYAALTNGIFHQPAYNGNPSMMDGYGRKTAAELNLTGKEVYNEYPDAPKVVQLHAQAVLLYDTASLEILYLDGCRRGGKNWFNRVKLVTTTVTVEKRVEVPVEKRVEVPVEKRVEVRVPVPCPDCPVGRPSFKFSTTFKGRLSAAAKQLFSPEGLVGLGIGVGVSAARGGDRGDLITSAGITVAENAAMKAFVADANRVKITIPGRNGGGETVELKKGESRGVTVAGAQGKLSWSDEDGVIVEFPGFPSCYWNKAPRESLVLASYSQSTRDGLFVPESDKEYSDSDGGPNYGDAPTPPRNKSGGGGRRNRNVFQ